MPFGITNAGFSQKKVADIVASLQTAEQAAFGTSIATGVSSSIISQLNGIFANELASVWQLAQDVYSNSYPSTAGGVQLALIRLLTGSAPLAATQSWAIEVFVGTNATVVGNTTLLAVTGTLALFQVVNPVTIATLTAWGNATNYVGPTGTNQATATAGSLATNAGNIYYCVQGGLSASAPTGTGTNIADGTCLWNYVAAGTAAVAGVVASQSFSPITAAAYGLTIIQTPASGLSVVTNPLGATLGTLVETDAAFRIRSAALVRASGNGTIASITSKLLSVVGVTQCVVVNNPTSAVVAGQPANSFAPYVLGGANQDIWNAIVAAQPSGIQSWGNVNGTGLDAANVSQPAGFTRPTVVNIYVAITLTSGTSYSGATSVKNAIVAYANALFGAGFGPTIVANRLYQSIYGGYLANSVGGVTEVTALYIGTAPAPASAADIVVAATNVATFNTANTLVNGA